MNSEYKKDAWMDAEKPAKERAALLLREMTVPEKIGQLNQHLYGFRIYEKDGNQVRLKKEFYQEVEKYSGMGALYALYRADPWSERDFESGLTGDLAVQLYNEIQSYVMTHSRLHIPVIMSSECPHGHQALDGYLLPVNLAAGASFDPARLREAYQICGRQLKSMGAHLALSSMLDMLRDPRWGRSEECYGEDPYLSAQMAYAAVKGLTDGGTAVVAKHFAAQGAATGGINAGAACIGEHELREIHLPAAQGAIAAGAKGVMAAYNEIDGIYCHANRKLLTEILREEYGFDGIVMADALAIDRIDQMSGDNVKSAALALRAGVDVGLLDDAYGKLQEALERGLITEEDLDRAAMRVLTLKFETGLFEHPFVDVDQQPAFSYREYPQSLALSRESVILLKNGMQTKEASENGAHMLPIEEASSIGVIGPNADDIYSQLGDYTPPVQIKEETTVYRGIKQCYPEAKVIYAKGSGLMETSEELLAEAEEVAAKSDVNILVLGSSSSRFGTKEFDDNGAAKLTDCVSMDCGEGLDRSDLTLPNAQLQLLRCVRKKSKKLITVVITGRPLILNEIIEESDAVLLAFYPGPCGGQAIAEMIRGLVNPSGRLPVSLPRANGQLPVFYNYRNSYAAMQYLDENRGPLFSFGYGLDYTSYAYTDVRLSDTRLTVEKLKDSGVKLWFRVANTGERAGRCVPQLYLTDVSASVIRRVRELKGFAKIALESGEKKEAAITLAADSFALYDKDMKRCIEPGIFRLTLMDQGKELWTGEVEVAAK